MSSKRHSPWYATALREQLRWKRESEFLPEDAREAGTCFIEDRGQRQEVGPFPICVPLRFADHNLLPSIRAKAIDRFQAHGIEWHGWSPGLGEIRWPSSHLLDSQVQCVNVLLSLERVPELLLAFARQIDPEIRSLAMIEDGSPIAFEWIGDRDHLGEAKGRPRDRGRRATSSDAILVGERADGRTLLVIEWKFTENYPEPVDPRFRVETYRAAYQSASIFRERPPILSFFQEPHYQLLRLSLLARAMIDHGEFADERAAVVHVVPARNRALRTTTTPELRTLGTDITTIWTSLLPGPQVRYVCVESEALFRQTPELEERYGGLVEGD